MQTIKVNASRRYDIRLGSGILTGKSGLIAHAKGRRVHVVSDDRVFALYGRRLMDELKNEGIAASSTVFLHGEKRKNLKVFERIVDDLFENRMTRDDLVIAFGGGVVGDIAGFAAASYQRGIEYVQIPTTLLADVDSSVGGKTAIDIRGGKNQIGAFYQPGLVVCDIELLGSLPSCEYRNGCAEIIKYAMIGSPALFDDIKAQPVKEQYERVIAECVTMKRDLVEKDEFDHGDRMLLNFGHTVGHAVEVCSGYKIPHGRAVAIGMAVITRAAVTLGYCDKNVCLELVSLLKAYRLPYETSYSAEQLCKAMVMDKKGSKDEITLIVPERIGRCIPVKVHKDKLIEWMKAGGI